MLGKPRPADGIGYCVTVAGVSFKANREVEQLMFKLDEGKLLTYLESLEHQPVQLLGVSSLGEPKSSQSLKGYGYGIPIRLD